MSEEKKEDGFKLSDQFETPDKFWDRCINRLVKIFNTVKMGWIVPLIFSTYHKFRSWPFILIDTANAVWTVFLYYLAYIYFNS